LRSNGTQGVNHRLAVLVAVLCWPAHQAATTDSLPGDASARLRHSPACGGDAALCLTVVLA